jgi:hypothetical protein
MRGGSLVGAARGALSGAQSGTISRTTYFCGIIRRRDFGYLRLIVDPNQLRIEYHPAKDGTQAKTPDWLFPQAARSRAGAGGSGPIEPTSRHPSYCTVMSAAPETP